MSGDHSQFDDEGDWPRWLLHIDSLTSHPWQPGNIYGGICNPVYNAMSYTWGRFQTKSEQVGRLPIKGITWEPHLPRIHPAHFSCEELRHALETASCPFIGYDKVDFLWIDIACIDQRPGSAELPNIAKAMEIGRQIKIFRGAKDVFVWLTAHKTNEMTRWIIDFYHAGDFLWAGTSSSQHGEPVFEKRDAKQISQWLDFVQGLLDRFTRDPWFHSLWTLQEAFLRPDAMLVFRDGMTDDLINMRRYSDGSINPWRLEQWINDWHFIQGQLDREALTEHRQTSKLMFSIQNIGFLDAVRNKTRGSAWDDDEYPKGYVGNPLGLVAASSYRNPKRAEDRVYGIMQVFDLRLGVSRPGAARNHYDLEELMDELGTEVFKKSPIASQLVQQTHECPRGKAWRISQNMTLPDAASLLWRHLAYGGVELNEISGLDTKIVDGIRRACFTGRITAFNRWHNELSTSATYARDINLDARWTVAGSFPSSLASRMAWLLEEFPSLQLLLLGRTKSLWTMTNSRDVSYNNLDWGIGLLLNPEETIASYERIGTLTWEIDWKIPEAYAHGFGDGWSVTLGVFG